jgi:mono/diheme cytochrome c family protein
MKIWIFPLLCLGLCSSSLNAALPLEDQAKLPAPADHPIDFAKEIKPIFEASCIKCHGRGKDKGGFKLDDRSTFMQGGDSGPVVVVGKSAESLLVEVVSGLNPDNVMPQKGSKLKPQEVAALRAWIDQGAQWDPHVTFAKPPAVNLVFRKPALPSIEGAGDHPIDRLFARYSADHQLNHSKPASDRVFARRVYLDLIGLLPTPEELDAFENDASPEKRSRLADALLARNSDFAQHWLTFWNDALRNDYKGTGYIDGGRKQITSWLYSALAANKPYNKFVAELINPTPASEGFAKGIVWRGVVNASQTPQMQAAQNISQVFMGVNLKCASCHDSFINDWTLADAYGLAGIYADTSLEMFKCDVPTGKKAELRFIFPELGKIDAAASKEDRLKQLAEIVTADKNARLTRTIVNRLWARFMGRGLVEPVDDMDSPAWDQDLLDYLAADLSENNYDLKRTMKLIVTSRAYQLPSVQNEERAEGTYVFRGPLIRRMTAEQFVDAVSEITGAWAGASAAQVNFSLATGKEPDPDFKDQPAQPKWIWKDYQAAEKTEAITIYLRKFINLPEQATEASFLVSCDNEFTLYINGKEAGKGKDHTKPTQIQALQLLRPGINLIAVAAQNGLGNPGNKDADQANPAGLFVYARIRQQAEHGPEKVMDFGTDSSWLWSASKEKGWEQPEFAAAGWYKSAELGEANTRPWGLGPVMARAAANIPFQNRVRASLREADSLMTAMGRPNREQVMTSRASTATTLQALELTNGQTLTSELRAGAEKLIESNKDSEKLIKTLYHRAFGRSPTTDERNVALELLGSSCEVDRVQDFLWAMTMLPEFQLIY